MSLETVTRKYVVIYNCDTKKLQIGVTAKFKYHIDIFGERLDDPWIFWSAGFYTIENDQTATLRTHGDSQGLGIGPRSGDDIILRAFEGEGEMDFDLETIKKLHHDRLEAALETKRV